MKRNTKVIKKLTILLVLAAVFFVGAYCGVLLYRKYQITSIRVFLKEVFTIERTRTLPVVKPEILRIRISQQAYDQLLAKRNEALERKILVKEKNDQVKGGMTVNGVEYQVKLRLKGDWVDHLKGERWSFMVKMKKDAEFHGMRVFSLQTPVTRNWVYEKLYHEMLSRNGIISLKYFFVQLFLNDEDLGIYAVEEHFNEDMLAHNHRQPGPIVKFNEDDFFKLYYQPWNKNDQIAFDREQYLVAPVEVYQDEDWLENKAEVKSAHLATRLLTGFRQGALSTSEVFDMRLLAMHYAISDLFAAGHGLRWHNKRYYLNKNSGRLEPVGFDGMALSTPYYLSYNRWKDWHETETFQDTLFYLEYLQALDRVSDAAVFNAFRTDMQTGIDSCVAMIQATYPYYNFSWDTLELFRIYIHNQLYPTTLAQAHVDTLVGNKLSISIGNMIAFPTEIMSVQYRGRTDLLPVKRILLQPRIVNKPVHYEQCDFLIPGQLRLEKGWEQQLKIRCRIAGFGDTTFHDVHPWQIYND